MSRRGLTRNIHAVAPRETADRWMLMGAFALGAGGGVALKLLGAGPFISALFAAAVLVAYAVGTYYATHLRLEPEAIGDNCYYLGFLFTLTSLSVTLYFVVEAGAESRADLIPEVISGFGVALSSTIMGVFLRVLMMQFRIDLVARDKETRLELDMAARSLREEMSRSIRHVKSFTIESVQHAQEREEAMRRHTDAMLADVRDQMRQTAQHMRDAMQKSTDEQTAASLAAIQQQSLAATLELKATIQDASIAILDSAKTAFDALNAETNRVSGFRAVISDEIDQLASTVTSATAQIKGQIKAQSQDISASYQAAADNLPAPRAGAKPAPSTEELQRKFLGLLGARRQTQDD